MNIKYLIVIFLLSFNTSLHAQICINIPTYDVTPISMDIFSENDQKIIQDALDIKRAQGFVSTPWTNEMSYFSNKLFLSDMVVLANVIPIELLNIPGIDNEGELPIVEYVNITLNVSSVFKGDSISEDSTLKVKTLFSMLFLTEENLGADEFIADLKLQESTKFETEYDYYLHSTHLIENKERDRVVEEGFLYDFFDLDKPLLRERILCGPEYLESGKEYLFFLRYNENNQLTPNYDYSIFSEDYIPVLESVM